MADTDALLRVLILIGLIVLIFPLLMMSVMWLMGMSMGPMGTPALFGIVPLLLALAIGYGGYRLLKRGTERDNAASDSEPDPIEHLKEQYASGEITEAEFEQKLDRQLDSGRPSEPTSETSVDTTSERNSEFER